MKISDSLAIYKKKWSICFFNIYDGNCIRPASNLTELEWDEILSVNLKGTFFCVQEPARYMIRGNARGCIIYIASQ